MSKYLYGASIQGIQSFIFQTNKLKEIVGGSELVNRLCTKSFKSFLGGVYKEENLIIGAAGNIKYLFDKEEDAKITFKNFPRYIMESAPGITISQAICPLSTLAESLQEVEDKLKTQRSIRSSSFLESRHFMVSDISSRSAGPRVLRDNDENFSPAQEKKIKEINNANHSLVESIAGSISIKQVAFDSSELLGDKSDKRWIGVVHADGNSLGILIQKLFKEVPEDKVLQFYKGFSNALDSATKIAAGNAFKKVVPEFDDSSGFLPIRPIIIGGDDLTVIIRGDLAIPFTEAFLDEFEKQTSLELKKLQVKYEISLGLEKGLTACAGIAFIKPNFPLHFGVQLADDLCKSAKDSSKKIEKTSPPSSLEFHKVQSSFVDSYEQIAKRELICSNGLNFNFGPYFLKPQQHFSSIDQLKKWTFEINRPTAPKSDLRRWVTLVKSEPDEAKFLMKRILAKSKGFANSLDLTEDGILLHRDSASYSHIYKIIQAATIH